MFQSCHNPASHVPGVSAALSQKLCRYQERHRVLPSAVGQRALFGAVGVHDKNLTVLLERVVVERASSRKP